MLVPVQRDRRLVNNPFHMCCRNSSFGMQCLRALILLVVQSQTYKASHVPASLALMFHLFVTLISCIPDIAGSRLKSSKEQIQNDDGDQPGGTILSQQPAALQSKVSGPSGSSNMVGMYIISIFCCDLLRIWSVSESGAPATDSDTTDGMYIACYITFQVL